jgi:hypothetical protein
MKKCTPVKVAFEGKQTEKGARRNCEIYYLRLRRKLDPKYTETSKTGKHWTDYYWLCPGNYILAKRDISNAGNHHCFVAVIEVKEDGSYEVGEHFTASRIPEFVHLPCYCT